MGGRGGAVVEALRYKREGRGITGVPRGGSNPHHPKFRSFEKAGPNSQFYGIYICNNLIRIRVSLIYKLSQTPN
jgi:hypothetical protein